MATPPDAGAPPFAPVDEATWRAQVERDLRGQPFDSLVARTLEGIDIAPLYTADDLDETIDEAGLPGLWPRIRGAHLPDTTRRTPRVCAVVGERGVERAARALGDEIAGGASAVLLELTGPHGTLDGLEVHSLRAMAHVLDGIDPSRVAVGLSAGPVALPAAATLLALARRRGTALTGWLGLDPLGTLAAAGALPTGAERAFCHLAEALIATREAGPELRTLTVDTSPYHHAGCSETQALGIAMATATAYLRAAEAHGVDPAEAARRTSFTVRLGSDFFMGVAAQRALRWLWSRVLEACGIDDVGIHVVARPTERMLTRRDPWVNMLRNTAATFAAIVGGADVVVPVSYDALGDHVSDLGRRVARNTPLLLAEEAHLDASLDPAGGSYFIEKMTTELAERGWQFFQDLEHEGGMLAVLESGYLATSIEAVHRARSRRIATREQPITGVSEFPLLDEHHLAETHDAGAAGTPHATTPPSQIDAATRAQFTEPIEKAAHDLTCGPRPERGSALVEALIAAAGGGVGVERMAAALRTGEVAAARDAWANSEQAVAPDPRQAPAPTIDVDSRPLPEIARPASIVPLAAHRFAAEWERLRDASDELMADEKRGGARPRVFVTAIGELPGYRARLGWARNLMQAGGFEVAVSDPDTHGTDALVDAWRAARTPLAMICGTDVDYGTHGAALLEALLAAGARGVVVAGKPAGWADAFAANDRVLFAHVGADLLALMTRLWDHTEALT